MERKVGTSWLKYIYVLKNEKEGKRLKEDAHYPPAEQRPRARRSSVVVGSTEVRSEADNPAAPSPPKVPKN